MLKGQLLIIPVILSGGSGSRLWPLSREAHPKPFIKLKDGHSLIQKTYLRACMLEGISEIVTVTNRDLFFYTKDEFDAVNKRQIYNTFLLEPFGRNSTAAIAMAAQYATFKYGEDCTLLILPADHLIEDEKAFVKALQEAIELSKNGKLVTFGIKPDAPKIGFGYIEARGNEVIRFVEKPSLENAKAYIANGNFFWNSGMFCMTCKDFNAELKNFYMDIAERAMICVKNAKYSQGNRWQQYEICQKDFEPILDISVDYAIFEKSKNVAMVSCDIGWSDIGSWIEFGNLYPSDIFNNNISGHVLVEEVKDCIIHGSNKLITALGVENLIIADTADALLIAHKDHSQDIRKIVNQLKINNTLCYREFLTVHRPWGMYTVLQEGEGFKIKRIEVKPGGRLSLQSHKHRNEHWVVLSGVGTVTNGDEIIDLQHNHYIYIPAGNKHCLENRGVDLLLLIEVQCGTYLGEDDIIRYNDIYGRIA